MSVKIEEINVRNLGPINDLQIKLGIFNLIYGKNERGKTSLVEFIIRSLFKTAKAWKLRDFDAKGSISVSGIGNEFVSFSPSSSRKIEDYLSDSHEYIPPNIAKVLVVKGAELELIKNSSGGINRAILRELLSNEALLDIIQERISKTLQKASIIGQTIEGANTGEISRMRELEQKLMVIDELFLEIDEVYSGGQRILLQNQLREIQDSIEKQKAAKRFRAFQLDSEIHVLHKELGNLDQNLINEIRESNQNYKKSREGIEKAESEIDQLQRACNDYEWTKCAIASYKERVSETKFHEKKYLAVLAAMFGSISIISLVSVLIGMINLNIGLLVGILSIILAIIIGGVFIWSQSISLRNSFSNFEAVQIAKEFENRFNKKILSLAQMETILEQLQPNYYKRQTLQKELPNKVADLEACKNEIIFRFSKLGTEAKIDGPWDHEILDLENKLKELNDKIHKKEINLSRLNVDPENYLEADPGLDFKQEDLEELNNQEKEIEEKFESETTRLQTLKQKICQETGDVISIDWENLIAKLQTRRQETSTDYRNITTEIFGKIIVKEEICIIREQQDARIQEILDSDMISEPLFQITRRYNKLMLDGDQLIVSDLYSSFPISELSTGALEQVLLSLRLGVASKITGKESLFLILDDAFQHADWERREWLLDKMVALASIGWQIIYLTMDDHIRDLFINKGKEAFEEFTFVNIDETSRQTQ